MQANPGDSATEQALGTENGERLSTEAEEARPDSPRSDGAAEMDAAATANGTKPEESEEQPATTAPGEAGAPIDLSSGDVAATNEESAEVAPPAEPYPPSEAYGLSGEQVAEMIGAVKNLKKSAHSKQACEPASQTCAARPGLPSLRSGESSLSPVSQIVLFGWELHVNVRRLGGTAMRCDIMIIEPKNGAKIYSIIGLKRRLGVADEPLVVKEAVDPEQVCTVTNDNPIFVQSPCLWNACKSYASRHE